MAKYEYEVRWGGGWNRPLYPLAAYLAYLLAKKPKVNPATVIRKDVPLSALLALIGLLTGYAATRKNAQAGPSFWGEYPKTKEYTKKIVIPGMGFVAGGLGLGVLLRRFLAQRNAASLAQILLPLMFFVAGEELAHARRERKEKKKSKRK